MVFPEIWTLMELYIKDFLIKLINKSFPAQDPEKM